MHPREYSPTTFPSAANETAVNVDVLNLSDIDNGKNMYEKNQSEGENDKNSALSSLKPIKSLKNPSSRHQQQRGACTGASLDSNCPVM